MALSRVEVSVAYPMLSFGYIVNALAAWWLFGEAVSIERMAGIAVIIFGVFLITRS
jgi:multidrug transporter EmrE-like cation transporter